MGQKWPKMGVFWGFLGDFEGVSQFVAKNPLLFIT